MDLLSQLFGIPVENLKVLSWVLLGGLSFKLGTIHAARVSVETKLGILWALGAVANAIAGSYLRGR